MVAEKIRLLTNEEREIYGGAVIRAIEMVPAFRDAVALIRPFYDPTAGTAYTDAFARVGLSEWFFKDLNPIQRASVILHECMHVLNSHITRGAELGNQGELMNFAGDFEINSGLSTIPSIQLKDAIFPNKEPFDYKPFQSMEQYFHMLKRDFVPPCPQHGPGEKAEQEGDSSEQSSQDSQGPGSKTQEQESSEDATNDSSNASGQAKTSENQNEDATTTEESSDSNGSESSGSESKGGKAQSSESPSSNAGGHCTCEADNSKKSLEGNPCDDASDARSAQADAAGVERASEVEQTLAKKNTNARIVEEINKAKSRGDGAMTDFLQLAQRHMQPAKVSWQSILRRVFSRMNDAVIRGRADYSYRRVNRRSHGSEYIFPGMVQYMPTAMFGIDTSGSMSSQDYNVLLNEVEGIIKALSKKKDSLKVFTVDTTVNNISPVSSVKQIKLLGGGGTDMSVGWKYVNSLPKKKKPDVFVLATDGFTSWEAVYRELTQGEKDYRSIILITHKDGFKTVTAEVKAKAMVIDVS